MDEGFVAKTDARLFAVQIGFVKWLPGGIPIMNQGKQRIRPTYVGDVAHVLALLQNDNRALGKVVELYG